MAWGDFLRIPSRSDHAVQMYGAFDLSRAVDDALKETVSDQEAARIYIAAAEANGKIPLGEAVLDWLLENEPGIARRVLPPSRQGYRLAS